jgi:predicted ABC-type ATPase
MIKRWHACIRAHKSFIFETTASGISYAAHLKKAKHGGYKIDLLFLWLLNAEQAVKRVAQRVKQGGHHVPEEDIVRRYSRGLTNLVRHYLPLADTALVLDNSEPESGVGRIIARKEQEGGLVIEDPVIWEKIGAYGKI